MKLQKHAYEGVAITGSVTEFLAGLPACAGESSGSLSNLAGALVPVTYKAGSPIPVSYKTAMSGDLLVMQTGSLNVRLRRPDDESLSQPQLEMIDGDAAHITLVAGDVVGEKSLAALCGEHQLTANCSISLLRLPAEHIESTAPERMRWMGEYLVVYKVLKSMDCFRILTSDQVEGLVRAAKPINFQLGDVVSTRGSTGPSPLWIILSGLVTVTRPDLREPGKMEVLGRLGVVHVPP